MKQVVGNQTGRLVNGMRNAYAAGKGRYSIPMADVMKKFSARSEWIQSFSGLL